MKLTKTEKAAILLTLLFLVFTLGVHSGAGRIRDSFTISTQSEAPARQTASDAAANTAEMEYETPLDEAAADSGAAADGKININTAGLDELMRLNGIGEKLAGRIIADREENGAFAHIEDITRVSGIGEIIYMGICEDITVE